MVPNACLGNHVYHSKESVILDAAKILRDEIIERFKDFTETIWRPSTEKLSHEKRKPPDIVYSFLNTWINPSSPLMSTVVNSCAQDLIYAVTRGKIIQKNIFSLH